MAGGLSTFGYAEASPIQLIDSTGEFAFLPILVNAGIGGATDLALQLLLNDGRLECVDWQQVLIGGALGAATGGLGGALQKARKIREAYKSGLNNALYSGPTQAEASLFRRELGAQLKNQTPAIFRGGIFARNVGKYGDKLGPGNNYATKRVEDILLKNSRGFDTVLKLPSRGLEPGGAMLGGALATTVGGCECRK